MIIKLDSIYGVMRVNSDNITTYFRENNQLLTQLNMTDGKLYLIENSPEEIDELIIGGTDYSKENTLKIYKVRYGDMGRFFTDIPDIEAHSIEEAVILCKKYIKEHKTDTAIFSNLFNGIDYNKIIILDENDDRHQIRLSKHDF